jgi:hypothetical protein
MKVIGLERGPRHWTADFAGQEELRYFHRPNPKRQPVTWRPNAMLAVPFAPLNYGIRRIAVGATAWVEFDVISPSLRPLPGKDQRRHDGKDSKIAEAIRNR